MNRTLPIRSYHGLAALLIGVSFAFRLPVLRTGFTVDDYAQLAMMRGFFPVARPPLQLFTFSEGGLRENFLLRAAGFLPWWSQGDLRISLFRPLSSALMWFDLKAFGDNAYFYHVHSACWWICMMALLAVVLRHVLPPLPALLALALCGAQSAHGMFLGWIANRNAVVASSLALAGIWALLRAHKSAARRARCQALVAFGLALCAGEYAIGFLAYAVAYELRDARSWRERAWKLLPWCALLASYLIIRAALGFGTRGSGMYIDPLSESAAFFRAALVRLPISSGDLVLGIQANWWSAGFPWAESWSRLGFWPRTWAEDLRPLQLVQVWCGVVAMSIATSVCFALFRGRGSAVSARNRWVILATPLALLPSLSSVPESRLLLPPLFGWSILMGTCAWDCAMGWVGARQRGLHRVGGVALVTLVACQLIGPPFYVLPVMRGLPQLAQAVRSSILAPELDDTLRAGRRVLLLAAADPTTTIYLPLVRRVHGRPALGSCHLLTSAFAQQRLDRLSPTTFVIERLQTNMTPLDVYATAFNREPLQSAQQFTADGLQVTVERVLDGRPMRTRYKLDVSLDDPAVVLLQQTLSGLRRVSFPAVGHSVVLDPPVPPFALIANP